MLFSNILLSLAILSFSSCNIEGEEICGIWNTNGDYGAMQVEITPWKGKFWGYMLAYKNGEESITGNKTKDFIIISDLVFKDKKYQEGKIYPDPNSEIYCKLTLKLLNDRQVKAVYNCDGQISSEVWYRKGYNVPQVPAQKAVLDTTEKSETKEASFDTMKNEAVAVSTAEKPRTSTINTSQSSALPFEGKTRKRSTFYIAGIQEVIEYDDFKAMEKTIENLWSKAYKDDFSDKLKNIINPNRMYVSYSSYDNPKGKMAITLGYEVKDLSNIPPGLKGIKIPDNEYLVYPLSGDKSDFEGEGWEQLYNLIMYREADSADFEIYTFDDSYKVKTAEMWIATK